MYDNQVEDGDQGGHRLQLLVAVAATAADLCRIFHSHVGFSIFGKQNEFEVVRNQAGQVAHCASPEAFPATWQLILRSIRILLTHEISLAGVNVIAWNT